MQSLHHKYYIWMVIHVPLLHVGSTLKTFCFKQKLKLFQETIDLEKLLFYQQTEGFPELKEIQMKTFCFQK